MLIDLLQPFNSTTGSNPGILDIKFLLALDVECDRGITARGRTLVLLGFVFSYFGKTEWWIKEGTILIFVHCLSKGVFYSHNMLFPIGLINLKFELVLHVVSFSNIAEDHGRELKYNWHNITEEENGNILVHKIIISHKNVGIPAQENIVCSSEARRESQSD